MKQLSGLDAAFLHLEQSEMPMHIGALQLFDLPQGYRGDFYENVKAHVGSRLHLVSLFTKKLAHLPLDFANPVWIEDADVDLDYHVQQLVLPGPGTMAQLEAMVGRLHSNLLDRSRPLWEFHVIEGLASGQAALYVKVHHSVVDGVGAESLARAMLDLSPEPRTVAPAPARKKDAAEPDISAMLANVMRHTAAQYWKIVKYLPTTARTIGSLMLPSKEQGGKRKGGGVAQKLALGPKTPLNAQVTGQRVFATLRVPVDEAKAIGKAFGGSLNDAVLAICSAALRRYLEKKDALPAEPLKVVMPVNLREQGNTELNNQFSFAVSSLPTNQASVKERMQELVQSSNSLKTTLKRVKSILPTDLPSVGVPWLMRGLGSLYGRIAGKMPPIANVLISNVPGVPVPMYMAGARMTSFYPVSIPLHGIALNITVQSYNGMLDFGLTACRRAVPDVRELAQFMRDAHLELAALLPDTAAEKLVAMPARRKATKKAAKPHTAMADAASAGIGAFTLNAAMRKNRGKAAVRNKQAVRVAA